MGSPSGLNPTTLVPEGAMWPSLAGPEALRPLGSLGQPVVLILLALPAVVV